MYPKYIYQSVNSYYVSINSQVQKYNILKCDLRNLRQSDLLVMTKRRYLLMRYSGVIGKTKEYEVPPSPGTRPLLIYKINCTLWMDLSNCKRNKLTTVKKKVYQKSIILPLSICYQVNKSIKSYLQA